MAQYYIKMNSNPLSEENIIKQSRKLLEVDKTSVF